MPSIRCLARLAAAMTFLAAPMALADDSQQELIRRGEYLAKAGDCSGCHTNGNGPFLAGGQQIETPYGTIASPNITPDKETGIGNWTDDQFYRLMHDGIDASGNYVYPVMPFDHYTKVTRDDVLAIKAYLFSVPPVHAPREKSHLEFPFDIRESLAGWRLLFFKPATFEPDHSLSDEQNRGAYLVEGLGHCGSCHTPRNILSGSEQSKALGGGEIKGQGWFAPNISSDVREGIGGWSQDTIVGYLKTGIAPGHALVAGPMTDVIHESLRFLTDQDLAAIASYLKATPAKELYAETHLNLPDGAAEYLNHCGFCHQPDGKGLTGAIPPLAGDGTVLAGGPEDVIRTILGGRAARATYSAMPGFATILTGPQIADITNYVRTSWGNGAPANATVPIVEDLTKTTATMLSGTAKCDPVGPPAVASAIASSGADAALHQINQANMLEQVDAFLPKMMSAGKNLAPADVVNGLTAAYCPIIMGNADFTPRQRLLELQQFAILVYSQLRGSPNSQALNIPVVPAKN